ncbi:hypothetical protein AMTRI_Chr04g184350 [Amborella trichopoda]
MFLSLSPDNLASLIYGKDSLSLNYASELETLSLSPDNLASLRYGKDSLSKLCVTARDSLSLPTAKKTIDMLFLLLLSHSPALAPTISLTRTTILGKALSTLYNVYLSRPNRGLSHSLSPTTEDTLSLYQNKP